jgi:hypothetical protein
MRFLIQIIGRFSSKSQRRSVTAFAGRRRPPIECQMLENRDLLSIAGVALRFGNLAITGTQASGNIAQVWIDPATHNLAVSLNGQSEEFAPNQVASITYNSGASGGDTFVNKTGLTTLAHGYGGNNHFTGGTGYTYLYFFGNNNSYNATGGVSDVWEDYGVGDVITKAPGASVTVYLN